MGMFDEVTLDYPIPGHPEIAGIEFQCKDTPAQWMEHYVVREDGTLWHHAHDTEKVDHPEDPLGVGYSIRNINYRWEQVEYEGGLELYGGEADAHIYWVELWFRDGKARDAAVQREPAATAS